MLTLRDLVTIRAALLFWQEEMCPHGFAITQPYLDSPQIRPLTAKGISRLRRQLQRRRVQYALYNPIHKRLATDRAFSSLAIARKECKRPLVPVAVLIPER